MPRTPAVAYLAAVLAVLVALLVRWLLWPVLGTVVPYMTFFPAVALAAYLGGLRPGLLATALGAVAADYFLVEPVGGFVPSTTADALGLVLFLAVGAFLSWVCDSLLRANRRAAAAAVELADEEERLRVTLTSIGDAVLVADAEARVTFLNPVAERLTGWATADAAGRPVAEVFRIRNEKTGAPAEDIVGRVLREGVVVGLANHTELVARDGSARPIEDSAAPIRDAAGAVTGAVVVFRDVSSRRETERLLRETRDRFESVVNHAPAAIFIKDREGRYLLVNDPFVEKAGRPVADILGRTDADLFPPQVAAAFAEEDRKVLAAGRSELFEEAFEYAGERLTFLTTKFPLFDEDGAAVAVCGIATDVTARKRAEEAAREGAERLRLALDAAGCGVWDWDISSDRVVWSDQVYALHGLRPGEFGGHVADFQKLVHPDDRERIGAAIREALETGREYGVEFRVLWPDGTVRWLSTTGRVYHAPDGGPARMLGVTRDVTEVRRAEDARRFLAEAGELLASSLDYEETLAAVARLVVPRLADWCSVLVVEPDGRLRQLAVTHSDPAKVAWAKDLADRYPPDPDASRGAPAVARTGRPELVPDVTDDMLVAAAKDADHLAILRGLGVRSALTVPLTARGRTFGAVTFVSAESGRRYGPDDLDAAGDLARRAALAVDNARLFRAAHDAMTRLGLLAEASGRLTGELDPAAVRAAILDLSHRLVAADAHAVWRLDPAADEWAIAESEGLSAEYLRAAGRVPRPAARPMPDTPVIAEDVTALPMLEERRAVHAAEGIVSLLAVPLRVHGRVEGTITFYYRTPRKFDDVTVRVAVALANLAGSALGTAELYQREADLRRRAEDADRRKDEFLAMLGHELRNPLAALVNGLHALREMGPAALGQVDGMSRQADVLGRLVDDLLDMARVSQGRIDLRREPVRLAEAVSRALETARPAVEAQRHALEVSLPADDVWLDADPVRLAQCVANLLNNAAKYTPPGGRIELIAECGTLGPGDGSSSLHPSSLVPHPSEVVIRVRDTGIGLAAEDRERVFELFAQVGDARSRSQGGLGIGLSLVRKLVGMMGGTVSASSAGPGKGSEFVIRLPARPAPPAVESRGALPEATPASATPPSANGRRLRVLIADDNADAAETLSVLVGLWGHEVRVVHDGPSAVDAAREFRPDVAFFDIGMPGFDGYEAARRVRAEPDLAGVTLIAMTGFGQESDRRRGAGAGFDRFLVKPVAPADVRELLQAAAAS